MHSDQLAEKVAVVTGGARGLGAGIAEVLLSYGATVAIADIDSQAAQQFVQELDATSGRAHAFAVDVTRSEDVTRVVYEILAVFGSVDVLVNNAGVHGAPGLTDAGTSFRKEDWEATFEVNVKGTVLFTEAVSEHMIPRRSGKIVNISSQAGRGEWPTGSGVLAAASGGAYGASKAAVIHMTQTYANKLGPYNINVNCVCPGTIFTDLWKSHAVWASQNHAVFRGMNPEEVFNKSIEERCPLGRPQTPEDIGNAVAFLASDLARNITGQALNVNGGQRMN